ncbi:uncharacterized protein N7459_005832 [Penicillium hispanicum]|uniref:uncharacterized protein n=1 Tax=Penicillium hispanicum TaxID=1080232 RepID=UPI002541844B|nr:uncharacterized protein N7459_005832 [Penicillium hispanicum]KAJ5579847.1 hypothetical protein N7459_005832 [Penicillium hispanicum]
MIMAQHCHIYDLADELLSEILSFLLESGPQTSRTTSSDSSREGANGMRLHHHEPIGHGEASDLDRFRLVCKRFMRIGTPRKFARFVLRFSEDGFRRLADLLEMQLACYVKTVTYLVRPFYEGNGWKSILRLLGTENLTLAQLHVRRFKEQASLVDTNYDLSQLQHAIASFSALQEIKLLRLQDEADEQLLDYIRDQSRHASITSTRHSIPEIRQVRFDWGPACSRAVTNLGIALLASQCTSLRFIGPQISPEATLQLLQAPSTTLAALGGRLTSLDITFHANTDISTTMSDLSGVFQRFFSEATNLVAIHIGFPPKTPLDLDLDAIFHGLRLRTLRTLSLQGWRLEAAEIIALARRHRRQLRDLRLCAVYLRPGARWTDVLAVLREEMERLERLKLREIDYETHFDALAVATGVEVFDEAWTDAPVPSSLSVAAGTSPSEAEGAAFGAAASDAYALPALLRERQLPLRQASMDKVRKLVTAELGDDGCIVHRDQISLWEAWVLSASSSSQTMQNGSWDRNWNGNGNGHSHGQHN